MSNKSTGTKFELELSETLAGRGFWVHRLQDNQNGQPCDLIACRNGQAWLIDCKNCQGDFFQLSRMEENQRNAMTLFRSTGNRGGLFAIRFSSGRIYMIPYQRLIEQEQMGMKRLHATHCAAYGMNLEYWMTIYGTPKGAKQDAGNDQQ